MVAIPGDKGINWRLDKFVEYQHLAPAVDPLTYCEYARRKGLDEDECVVLAWLHSLTYCEITAAFLLENFHVDNMGEVIDFWDKHKPNLIFGSARKYVKNMDWFVPLSNQFWSEVGYEPYKWLLNVANNNATPEERFKNIEKYLGKWKYMGRFSVDLFMEAIVSMHKAGLIAFEVESPLEYDWNKTSNLTSGLLNIFYMDYQADMFDKEGKIEVALYRDLDAYLKDVLAAVQQAYPDQRVDEMSVINKICSFRNLFKKARYGGFHHDRQLGNLVHYKKAYPTHTPLWDELFDIRADIFPHHMLGELNGWEGIRKERKKLWIEKGLTGVETIS